MIRRVVEFPDPFGAGHHVQVVEVITVGCSAGVITTWYHHRITVVNGHRFIQVSIIGKHPLEGKSLARVEAVIIDFLQG